MTAQLWQLFVCSLLILIGLWLTLLAAFDLRKANRAKSWPQVQGKILSSYVAELKDSEGTTYKAAIRYQYAINGVDYCSDIWRIRAGSSFTKSAAETVERYKAGTAVSVYVNPENPADALLEPGKISWSLFFGGAVFAFFGLAGLLHVT